jgi:malate dehydrogenase (oxaloacetate-decarboxylating)(NADP+)
MANPTPRYLVGTLLMREDVIIATGRSDYRELIMYLDSFIFRGALDVRARTINEEMKLAAVYALAGLAEAVPEQ